MKKTYVKPSIQVIELGIEAAMMNSVSVARDQQTSGFGTNLSTKSENSNNPWDASSWSAPSSNPDEE